METEEPIKDPKTLLETKCLENCHEFVQKLSECERRVRSRQGFTTEDCFQELADLTPCIDNCVMRAILITLGRKEALQDPEMIITANWPSSINHHKVPEVCSTWPAALSGVGHPRSPG